MGSLSLAPVGVRAAEPEVLRASGRGDLPGQKMWRVGRAADYGAFQDAARGRIDLVRVERYREDILRIGTPSTQVRCGPTT